MSPLFFNDNFFSFEYDYFKYLKTFYFVNAIITTSSSLMHVSLASHTRQEEWEQKSWCWRFSTSWVCRWCHQVFHVSYLSFPWSPPFSYYKSSFGFSALIFNDFTFPLGMIILSIFLHEYFHFQGPLCFLHSWELKEVTALETEYPIAMISKLLYKWE
jgi:hypothetical protein